jgi:hypothetical protein
MVSDPVSLQFILNSSHFTFGPALEDILYLSLGERNVMLANGWFYSSSDAYRWPDHDIPQTMIINGFEPP